MKKFFLSMLTLSIALSASAAVSLSIDGSTTVGPICDAFVEYFKADLHPDVEFTVKKTGSGDGATSLSEGRCDIAMMSRFMKTSEFEKSIANGIIPVAHAIAMDGVCVVVHPSNPVKELTTEQIRNIYNGTITNWKELGGADLKITPISRDTSSGTYETFHGLVMNKEKMASGVEYVNSNPQAHARSKSTKGAIAYVGLGFVDGNVRALKVDGVAPSRKTISRGIYPISRALFLFTNGYPELGSIVHEFCSFYLSEEGQEIIESKGFVPVTDY